MAYTEERVVDNPSWAQRLGSSLKGVLFGFVLFIAGFPILFWNEGRAVATAKRLAEGAGAVVDIQADSVDAANDGKLVHVSGKADTKDVLADEAFGVSCNALRLKRMVEIYQTVEESETKRVKEGDKTREITTYTYKKDWCKAPIDSAQFHDPSMRNANPPAAMPFSDLEQCAANVSLGAFKLSEKHVRRIGESKPFAFPADFKVPATIPGGQFQNGTIYIPFVAATSANGAAAASGSPLLAAAQALAAPSQAISRVVAVGPVPGDVRVTFSVVVPHDVTIVEQQTNGTLAPWAASDGETLSFVKDGIVPAAKIFADAKSTNAKITWLLRLAGLFVMFFGLKMVLGPLDTLVDVIPVVRGLVAAGTALVAGLLAGACALFTIGVAWIFYRPLIGIPLIVGGVALIVVLLMKKGKAAAGVSPAA